MAHRVFKYIAIAPLRVGHPGGEVVEYAPGDEIPAEVLGRSIGPLVLADKLARLIINVDDADGPAISVQPDPPAAESPAYAPGWDGGTVHEQAQRAHALAEHEAAAAENDERDSSDDTEYPLSLGNSLYQLSDGNTIKGKARAIAAEEALA